MEETSSSAGAAVDKADDQQPRTLSWSLTLDRKLPWSMNLEIGYVGNKSDHQMNWGLSEYNPVPLGAMLDDPYGNADAYRLMPNYGSLQILRHSAYLNYNAPPGARLAPARPVQLHRRLHLLEEPGPQGRGDERHPGQRVRVPARPPRVQLRRPGRRPHPRGQPVVEPAAAGPEARRSLAGPARQLAARRRLELRERRPPDGLVRHAGHDRRGRDHQQRRRSRGRPTSMPCPCSSATRGDEVPDGYLFNPACFTAPSPGANGSARQPYFKGQPYHNHDLSLTKSFPIGSGRRLQLRVSAYNVFNHPIAYPDSARNLTPRLRPGRPDEPRVRAAAGGQQVRAADRPARRPVRVLSGAARDSAPTRQTQAP